jgi:hypothetical protein
LSENRKTVTGKQKQEKEYNDPEIKSRRDEILVATGFNPWKR